MTSLFSPKPSIRSRPTRNGGLGGFVQVEVLAEEYGDSPTSAKEKRSSMINIFEKKRKRRSAPPPLAINLAQQGFVESAVTTGESFGYGEETATPPVPSLPKSPLRSASSPLTTVVTWQDESDTAATDRDSTVVQIGEFRRESTLGSSPAESSPDAQKPQKPQKPQEPQEPQEPQKPQKPQNAPSPRSPHTPRKSDGGPLQPMSRDDTLAITPVAPRRSTPTSLSPLTPRAEPELFFNSLPLRISPTNDVINAINAISPDENSLPTPLDKALPPLPFNTIDVIEHLLEPIELPGSILLPNQGFAFPALVPDQLSVGTIKTASSESTDDHSSIYSRTTSGSLPSLSIGSSPENKMGKFSSPRKREEGRTITAPIDSMESMNMDELLAELPKYTARTVSSVWLQAMKGQVQKAKEDKSVLESTMRAAVQACTDSLLREAKNEPLLAFAQHVEEIKTSAQDCAAKYYESVLQEPPILTTKIEQLNKDLDKLRKELENAHTVVDKNRGYIVDQSNFIGALKETHDANVNSLTRFIIRHAREVLNENNGDYLTREVWDIMRTYAIPMIMNDKIDSTSELALSSTTSTISSSSKSRPSSPSRTQPNSPKRPIARSVRISEDQYITLLRQGREMQSKLVSFQKLAAEQQEELQTLSATSDGYLEQIERHAKNEQSQNEELGYLRNEVKLFKKDVKGYKEDRKDHDIALAAIDKLAMEKVSMEKELQMLRETLSRKEAEASHWKLEAKALRNEMTADSRPSSEASQSSGTSLKPTHAGHGKSFPKIWQSSIQSRNTSSDPSRKEASSLRRDHSSGPQSRRKDLTIDTRVAGHSRSRSQSVGGAGALSRKLPASKSMLQIDSPKMTPQDASSSLLRHHSQRASTRTPARESNATNPGPLSGERSKGRNSSSPDEGMSQEMKFYGIDSPARSSRPSLREFDKSAGIRNHHHQSQSRGQWRAPRKPGEAPLHLVFENNVQQNMLHSPKVNNILGIQERPDGLNPPILSTNITESSKAPGSAPDTLRPRKSQTSLVSKSSSKDSSTSKNSNQPSSSCLGTAVKMTRGSARLTTILDKKLPEPPGNIPPRITSRQDTIKAPETAPILTPSTTREYLDLDPTKPNPRPQVHDRYPSGGVLDSPLKTTVHERYPSQGILSPDFLQPQISSTSPNSQASGGDKKVEVDEQDYIPDSPAQRPLRRKRPIAMSKAPAAAGPPTPVNEEWNKDKGLDIAQTPDSIHSETAALGQRSMDLLDVIGAYGYQESPKHHQQSSENPEMLVKVSENVPQPDVPPMPKSAGVAETDDNIRIVPLVPPRNHRRILSRVAEGNEPMEYVEVAKLKKANDDSGIEGLGRGEDAEMFQLMHYPIVRRQGTRRRKMTN